LAKENELMRRIAYPDLSAVFDDDFSRYPERETDLEANLDPDPFVRTVAEAPSPRATK